MRVVVVGAGIAGLAAAWRLERAGCDVTVLERSRRPGGVIDTESVEGFCVEWGPHSALASSSALLGLAREVALTPLAANPVARQRYIYRDGRLQRLPRGPLSLITTRTLSLRAKLRAVTEPWRRFESRPNETVAKFFERRLGSEIVDTIVNPFVSGVYAGRAEDLEMQSAFPRVLAAAEEAGSVVRGVIRMARAARVRPPAGSSDHGSERSPNARGPCTFEGGLSALPAAIAAKLGARIEMGVEVGRIVARPAGTPPVAVQSSGASSGSRSLGAQSSVTSSVTWTVHERGDATSPRSADAIVLATPASAAGGFLKYAARDAHDVAHARHFESLASELAAIVSAPIAVLHLGVATAQLARALDGFGFLVPAQEQLDILGAIWASVVFADRAPLGHQLITLLAGGAGRPDLLDLDDDELERQLVASLERAFGRRLTPTFRALRRIPAAIPQYLVGHAARVSRIHAHLGALPTLALAGNYLSGVSLEQAVLSGYTAADRLLRAQRP